MKKLATLIIIAFIFLTGCVTITNQESSPVIQDPFTTNITVKPLDNDSSISIESIYSWPIEYPILYEQYKNGEKTEKIFSFIRHNDFNGYLYSVRDGEAQAGKNQLINQNGDHEVYRFNGRTSGEVYALFSLHLPKSFKVGDHWQSNLRGPENVITYVAEDIEVIDSIQAVRIKLDSANIKATYWVAPEIGIIRVDYSENNSGVVSFKQKVVRQFTPDILILNDSEKSLLGFWEALIVNRDFYLQFREDRTGRISTNISGFKIEDFSYKATDNQIFLKFKNQSEEKAVDYSFENNIIKISWDRVDFHEGYGFIDGDIYYNYLGTTRPQKGVAVDRSSFLASVWLNREENYSSMIADYPEVYSAIDTILRDSTLSPTPINEWFEGMKVGYIYPKYVSYLTWLCTKESLSIDQIDSGVKRFVNHFNENYMNNQDIYRFQGRYISLSDVLGKEDFFDFFLLNDMISDSFHNAFSLNKKLPIGFVGENSFFLYYSELQ